MMHSLLTSKQWTKCGGGGAGWSEERADGPCATSKLFLKLSDFFRPYAPLTFYTFGAMPSTHKKDKPVRDNRV